MADDYYRFVERAHVLRGENTGRVYRLGDKVSVQVIKVDLERRRVDLGLTEILDRVRESERNRGPRVSRASYVTGSRGRTAGSTGAQGKSGKVSTKGDRRRAPRPGRRERARGKGKS
jgi:ribonuclease R